MKQSCGCEGGFSRRDFLKLSSLFTAAGAMPLLAQAEQVQKQQAPNSTLRIGYLPLTDAAPLLIAHSLGLYQKQGLEVEMPRLFRSWAQLVEAFLSGSVDVVHMLSPMTVWARYGSKAPAKVVAWNHTNGSTVTVAVTKNAKSLADLGGESFAVPFWYSVHNIVLQKLFLAQGIEPILDGKPNKKQVKLIVMAPSDMLPALATRHIGGYIVAEPFNAAAEILGVGKVLRFTGDVWRDHACCVVQMHEKDLEQRPEWSQKVVNAIVEAQIWIRNNRNEATKILSRENKVRYTPHAYKTLAEVMLLDEEKHSAYVKSGAIKHQTWDKHRINFQPYPYASYTESLVEFLKETEVKGNKSFLHDLDPEFVAKDLVDDRFVKKAIKQYGGMSVFGLDDSFNRQEVFQI